ncbi:hypothetical protein THAOC_35800 [Thalassiosira oceanica]|uniref:Uncharacterized protein n=1 Tax=Thalassiosira oceanica TaxID=159749 RepID=K0R9I3_THAOC|nr:hypothetical protein THAOC_35800 [Thalassiosira oceanica]|eukprot:EJK45581.1 hypothetical protein THAOC_35800 [Thalassiosira oceanica]
MAPSVHNGEGRRPSVPRHALDSAWLECGSSPQHLGIVVESESAALGTAVTTPHDVFWPRTTSSRLNKPRACHVRRRLRCFALQSAGIRASCRDSHIDSPSKLRRLRQSRRDVKRRLSASFPASGTPSSLAHCIPSPRGFGTLEHHQPPCIVAYARPRRTAARLSAPMSPRSAGEVAVIRHRAPLTPVLQTEPFQPEA